MGSRSSYRRTITVEVAKLMPRYRPACIRANLQNTRTQIPCRAYRERRREFGGCLRSPHATPFVSLLIISRIIVM
jgi:hypothetical protein